MSIGKPINSTEAYARAKLDWIAAGKDFQDARYRLNNAAKVMEQASADMLKDLQRQVAEKQKVTHE